MQYAIGNTAYEAGKMDVITQFHVARRLAPLVKGLGDVVRKVGGVAQVVDAVKQGKLHTIIATIDPFTMLQPILDALASMSDKDVDYVVNACLRVTSRKDGGAWVKVMAPESGLLMYPDIDYLAITQITYHAVQHNLVNFTRGIV